MRLCPECGKSSEEMDCPSCGVPTIPPSDTEFMEEDLVGTVFLEKYRVEELIGEGGMGCVYRAQQLNINRPVALKTLHGALLGQEAFLRRFRREARAASRLSSPHVVRVYDFGLDEKRAIPFIVMELLEGETLFDVLDRDGIFSLSRAVEVLLQVARALVDAEEAGIVHRDLKPENVFLGQTPDDADFAKVMDFGVARVTPKAGDTAESLNTSSVIVGTPKYMAPEQIRGEDVGSKADLYALGCLLHFMITGRPPYERDDNFAVMEAHLKAPIPPLPKQGNSGAIVPSSMVDLYYQLMAKQPRGRPSGAREALRQLSRIRDDVRKGSEGAAPRTNRKNKTQIYGSGEMKPQPAPTPSQDLSGGLAATAAGPSLIVGEEMSSADVLATTAAGPSLGGLQREEERRSVPQPASRQDQREAEDPLATAIGPGVRQQEPRPIASAPPPRQPEQAPPTSEPVAPEQPAPQQRVKSQTIVDFSEVLPNRNKQLVGIALGIVAVFIVGFAILFSSGSSEESVENSTVSSSDTAPPVSEAATPKQEAPAESEVQEPEKRAESSQEAESTRIKVLVESEPTGAEVRRNGILLGKTPMEINPDRSQPPFKLNFELAGYSPVEETVDPREVSEVRALLSPKAKTKSPRAGKVRKAPRNDGVAPRSQPRNNIDTMLD